LCPCTFICRHHRVMLFFLLFRPPLRPTLFPYTTLFRSVALGLLVDEQQHRCLRLAAVVTTFERRDVDNGGVDGLLALLDDLGERTGLGAVLFRDDIAVLARVQVVALLAEGVCPQRPGLVALGGERLGGVRGGRRGRRGRR